MMKILVPKKSIKQEASFMCIAQIVQDKLEAKI